jgi:glycosyltransferase involved in cell wall biosynthesis
MHMPNVVTRPRVLVATDDTSAGGTARVARQIADSLLPWFDIVFACRPDCATARALEEPARRGVVVMPYRIDEGSPWRNPLESLHATDEAMDLLEASGADLLLTFDAAELFSFGALKSAARRCGVPQITVINILLENAERRFGAMFAPLVGVLAEAEAIVFACEAHRRRFLDALPENAARKHVIPNSRPDRFFAPRDAAARARLREALDIPRRAFVCLTTARIEPHKGQRLIVRALAELRRRGEGAQARLVFAGGGTREHLAELEREIADCGLHDRVHLLGPREDVLDLLEASDAFILPSKSEATSLSIIEAMAKGLPIVATGVDGILELIDDDCAILLPLEEKAAVASIAAAIERLARDDGLRSRLAEAGRRRAEDFRLSRAAARYAALVTEILGRRGPRATTRRYERSLVRIGDAIDLADPAAAWNILREGWARSEPEGVWTLGARSTLVLRTDAKTGARLRLDFEIAPHVSPSWPVQESYVFADGAPIAFWRIAKPGRQTRSISIDVADESGRIELCLEHVRAVAPAALGDSDDPRALALFVSRVTVGAASADVRAA